MYYSRRMLAWTALLCAPLASCGGEDDGVPLPVAGGPPATPTPSPAPTSTMELPPPPFGLTASAGFNLVGWQQTSQPAGYQFALAADKAKLAWSAELKTYSVDLADLAAGRLFYTFGAAGNPASFSIARADGSTAKVYVSLYTRLASSGEIHWQTADGVQPFVFGHALFGLPVGALPVSGRREFVTDTDPQSSIVIDFANAEVSGFVTSFNDGGGWDPPGPKERAMIEPTILLPDGSFVAKLVIPGAPATGELRGRLFGTAGNELGVYWNGPARTGSDKSFAEWRAVMLYSACSSCPS